MNKGYVKLHRQMFENKLWLSEPFTRAQAWIDMFANASHKKSFIRVRGIMLEIKRGQLGWSEVFMAQRWGWSRNKVRRFMSELKTAHQVEQETTHQNMKLKSIFTIVNYDKYQTNDTTDDTSERDNRKTSEGTVSMNEKNEKNVNNKEVVEVIQSFSQINPSFKRWYGNTTQRSAIERMLSTHGREKLLQVISYLPRSNTLPYVPTVTSPYALEEKWADLEAALLKFKNKAIISRPNVIV